MCAYTGQKLPASLWNSLAKFSKNPAPLSADAANTYSADDIAARRADDAPLNGAPSSGPPNDPERRDLLEQSKALSDQARSLTEQQSKFLEDMRHYRPVQRAGSGQVSDDLEAPTAGTALRKLERRSLRIGGSITSNIGAVGSGLNVPRG